MLLSFHKDYVLPFSWKISSFNSIEGLSKYFDTSHKLLLTKLENEGFQESVLDMFENYFVDRIQYVNVNITQKNEKK